MPSVWATWKSRAETISRREIELVRLDGFSGEMRQAEDVLVLSLRLANRSSDRSFAPLEPSFVRDSSSAADGSYIETASGQRIAMYQLAPESEWSIKDQRFPVLEPGEEDETIIVSEPVRMDELAGPLIWHLKLRTGTYQTDVLGVSSRARASRTSDSSELRTTFARGHHSDP